MTKSEFVGFRLIPDEHQALLKIGRDEKMNISETVRYLIREVAKDRGVWPTVIKSAKPEGRLKED